jgi:hypothetical protein
MIPGGGAGTILIVPRLVNGAHIGVIALMSSIEREVA